MRISGQVWLSVLALGAAFGLTSASVGAPAAPPTLCLTGEEPVLSCGVAGGKVLSLCARGEALQYRFGRKGAPEMVWPTQMQPAAGRFFLSTTTYAGGGEERIRFSAGGFDYVVFSRMIAGEWNADGTRGKFFDEGVVVLKGGKVVGKKLCVTEPQMTAFPKMYDRLQREETEPLDITCCGEK